MPNRPWPFHSAQRVTNRLRICIFKSHVSAIRRFKVLTLALSATAAWRNRFVEAKRSPGQFQKLHTIQKSGSRKFEAIKAAWEAEKAMLEMQDNPAIPLHESNPSETDRLDAPGDGAGDLTDLNCCSLPLDQYRKSCSPFASFFKEE
jgi:hypothetical protein